MIFYSFVVKCLHGNILCSTFQFFYKKKRYFCDLGHHLGVRRWHRLGLRRYDRKSVKVVVLKSLSADFYRAKQLARFWDRNSVSPSVCLFVCLFPCLSVRLYVTHVLCDKKKEYTADILTPYERAITLFFRHRQSLMCDVPFHLKCALKVSDPPLKNADFDQYLLITPQT